MPLEKIAEDNWSDFPDLAGNALVWNRTEDNRFPYVRNDDPRWRVRINNFPEEPLYTLFNEKSAVLNFNDWPPIWNVPDY